MFNALILLIGAGLAAFGLLVMRNPMRLELLGPWPEGYYQRMVLDHFQRNQLRILGMYMSIFGLVIFTNVLSGLLSVKILDSVSEGMLAVLWASFIAGVSYGVIYSIILLVRGRGEEALFGWFKMWRQAIELGPVAVDPGITPRMHKETMVFTVIYCLLIALPLLIAIVVR